MIINRTYVTLEEVLEEYLPISFQEKLATADASQPIVVNNRKLYEELVENVFSEVTADTAQSSTTTNKLFCSYIYPKYAEECVAYYDDDDLVQKEKNIYRFMKMLNNRITTSYDEYNKLIKLYGDIENNLMDSIKSKSQTKFNDTPQTVTTSGVVSYNDTYNTSVTTNYGEVDGGSKIARLAEIEALLKDYYEKWCKFVCKGLFIYE